MRDYALDWPCAHDLPRPVAIFRESAADFRVDEELGFTLTGEGEHLWLLVEKTGLNTRDVVTRLSRIGGCPQRDIGYAGLKDRHAVTRQWFSVKTRKPMTETDVEQAGLRLLDQQRNARKCRLGSHRGNRFVITLRGLEMAEADREAAVTLLSQKGVPSYFGPQRFGREGANLLHAVELFDGRLKGQSRFKRGMFLSAARAYLFNQVLAARVRDGAWDSLVEGDVMALSGSNSVFRAEPGDPALQSRLSSGDIHPTGPLWGAGELASAGRVRAIEQAVADGFPELGDGLVRAGLKQERRPLRVVPDKLRLTPGEGDQLVVEFGLPTGAFATSVLRELVSSTGL